LESWTDPSARAAGPMAGRAFPLEHGLTPVHVASQNGARGRYRRFEDLRVSKDERDYDDRRADEERPPSAPHQKPNLTVVKYQKLEVSHRTPSIEASVRPTVGSAHPGSDWSRTIRTFAAKTP
jgi:hypothetical protein